VLWEYNHTSYPPREPAHPKPLLGDVYITEADTTIIVGKVIKDTWYDLHALAVDAQGADNIARIGIQLRDPSLYPRIPGNTTGLFKAAGQYFIETDGDSVFVRKTEDSSDWTAVADSTQDLYVDTNHFKYYTDGVHRKHFVIRFKLLSDAVSTEWMINAYAKDAEGNYPHDPAYTSQEGWYVPVGDGSVDVKGKVMPGKFSIASVCPNPFNPSTSIKIDVPKNGIVSLSIYNINGQKIRELANLVLSAGNHSFIWDGRDSSGNTVSAGVYFTRAEMGGNVATKKMLFLK
jgi:hypothetical protein